MCLDAQFLLKFLEDKAEVEFCTMDDYLAFLEDSGFDWHDDI